MSAKNVVLSSAVLSVAQIFTRCFDLVSIIILARLLNPESFGLVAAAASLMLLINSLTEISVSDVLIQKRAVEKRDFDLSFTVGLIRGALIATVVIAIAKPFAFYFEDNRLTAILYVLAVGPFFRELASPKLVVFQRALNYTPLALQQVAAKTISFVASTSVALTFHSYWALVVGIVAYPVVNMAASYIIAPYRLSLTLKGFSQIIPFTGWVTLSRIIWTLNIQVDRLLIASLLGKASLGQFTVGSDISSVATYALGGPLMQPLFSGFSRINDDLDRLRRAYLRGQQIIMMVIMPVGVGLATVSDPVVRLMLGPGWEPVIFVIAWFAPAVALQMLTVAVHSLSMALNQTKMLALRELVNMAVRLPPTVVGAWYYGLTGAVVASAISGLITTWVNLVIARTLLGVSVWAQISNCSRTLISVAVMSGWELTLISLIPNGDGYAYFAAVIALQVLTGAVVYILSHILLWAASGFPDSAESYVWGLAKAFYKSLKVRLRLAAG